MRIITGKLKGCSINYIKNKVTRPLRDSVKENIFNIIKHSNKIQVKIDNSNILDLYSGVGSFGLECMSLNAKNVTFVDKDNKATKTLLENLNKYSLLKKSEVINDKINNFLEICQKKFRIFFLDPPFIDNQFLEILKLIKEKKIFEKDHLVIIHREREKLDKDLNNILEILIEKKYGRSKVIFGVFN